MLSTAYTSGFSILALCFIIGFLFWKLKHVTWYAVAVYIFLALFWIIMTIARKSITTEGNSTIPAWSWPLVIASYQFIQVATRIPLGKLSGRMRSRQMPILITTTTILISGICLVASNFAVWAIIIATVSTGFFGATYGMQNQYWSENYNKRAVFITVAMITILPSLAALISTFAKSVGDITPNSETMRWYLIGVIGFLALIMIGYWIFPERKDTIGLDKHPRHEKISRLELKHIISLSVSVVFISISYNLINTGSGSQQDMITEKTNMESTILTIVAIVVALATALFLIRMFKSYHLVVAGHLLQLLGFVLGFIEAFIAPSEELRMTYFVVMTIGFTIFQNTLVGVTLHFDLKNALLVLGIWLTFRSGATGLGQVVGHEVKAYAEDMQKWLLVPATALTVISLGYSVYRYRTHHNVIYDIVDSYESEAGKYIW